jgi:hypothetical protein
MSFEDKIKSAKHCISVLRKNLCVRKNFARMTKTGRQLFGGQKFRGP